MIISNVPLGFLVVNVYLVYANLSRIMVGTYGILGCGGFYDYVHSRRSQLQLQIFQNTTYCPIHQ